MRERKEKGNRKYYLESSKLSKAIVGIERMYELMTDEEAEHTIYRTQNTEIARKIKATGTTTTSERTMRYAPNRLGERPHAPGRSLYKGN